MSKVLWNNEMDYCVGLTTEMDCLEFIEEAKRTHSDLTGADLIEGGYSIEKSENSMIWILEII